MDEIIKPGTVLVLNPSSQVKNLKDRDFFKDYKYKACYKIEEPSPGAFASLIVYIKKSS